MLFSRTDDASPNSGIRTPGPLLSSDPDLYLYGLPTDMTE